VIFPLQQCFSLSPTSTHWKSLSQLLIAETRVLLGVKGVEGILILGVDGLLVDTNGSVIFAVTKLQVRHEPYCDNGLSLGFLVTEDYYSNLDANLMRMDLPNRPELNKGTVDFVVSGEEYWAPPPLPRMSSSYFSVDPPSLRAREPKALDYLFMFDVSVDAVQSGFLKSACEVLRDLLYHGASNEGTQSETSFPRGCRLGILTYDTSLHFYNLSVSVNQIIASN